MRALPLFTLALCCFLTLVGNAQATIGYGSSDAVYPAKNQEYFYVGFHFGLETHLKDELKPKLKDWLRVVQLKDRKKLSPLRAAQLLLDQGIAVLVGFPTSHESVMVAELANKNQTLFISASAAHEKMTEFGPWVFSLGDSTIDSTHVMLNTAKTKYPGQKGIVFINKKAIFSAHRGHLIQKINQNTAPNMELIELEENLEIPNSALQKIRQGEYGFILNTTYVDEFAPALQQLIDFNIKLPIIANPAWHIGDVGVAGHLVTKYKGEIFCVSSLIRNTPLNKEFRESFSRVYKKQPEREMYNGYDLGLIVAKTLNRISGQVTKENFQQAFLQNPCFDSTTSGNLCFAKTGGHAMRKMHLLKFLQNQGFVSVD